MTSAATSPPLRATSDTVPRVASDTSPISITTHGQTKQQTNTRDAPVWDVTVFTNNWERLLAGGTAVAFLLAIMGERAVKRLLSDEHFSVDLTLIDAWASDEELPAQGRWR